LNSFKSGNSTLRSDFTGNPVNSSTFLQTSGKISLENDSNSMNWLGNSLSSLIFSDNFAISFSSSISTEFDLKVLQQTLQILP
tara:strand:- start:124 stop:372 length:249 start_codon:yes stop_codon:yes gene_type:complete